jgi:hypothetical protein
MDGGAQRVFGESTRKESSGANEHGHSRQGARQHERLVAGMRDVGQDRGPVRHDRHSRRDCAATVSSSENGWTLTPIAKPARELGDDGRFATTADAEISHADHRPAKSQPALGMSGVPATPPASRGRVDG